MTFVDPSNPGSLEPFHLCFFDGVGQGENVHPFGATRHQHLRTFIHRGPGGVDVVHQKDQLPFQLLLLRNLERASYALFPFRATEIDLGQRRFLFLQNPFVARDSGASAEILYKKKGLIETPLP